MPLRFGIPLTLVLAAAASAVSAFTGANIYLVLVLVTALGAAVDSYRLGLEHYATGLAVHPMVLFLVMALVWPIMFPWYLRVRDRIMREEIPIGPPPRPSRRAAIIAGIVVALSTAAMFAGWYVTRDLRRLARAVQVEFGKPAQVAVHQDEGLTIALPGDSAEPTARPALAHRVAVFAYGHQFRPESVHSIQVVFLPEEEAGATTPTDQATVYRWEADELAAPGGSAVAGAPLSASAIATLRERVQQNPGDVSARLELGFALGQAQQCDEGAEVYRGALRQAPSHAAALEGLAYCLRLLGRLEEAIPVYRNWVHASPDNPHARNDLGWSLVQLQRWEEALPYFRDVTRLHPRYARGHHNLGWTLASLGRYEEALGPLQEAASLDPYNAALHFDLAGVLHELGRSEEALASVREAIHLNPMNSQFAAGRSRILAQPEVTASANP